MDKAMYDRLYRLLLQAYREGSRLENAMETARAAWLDYEAEQKQDRDASA